jgi:hypothetical protein
MLGWIVLAAVALTSSLSGAVTLNKRARLREGPSKDTRLLAWVEEGTVVTIEGERNGWYAVRTPDGQTGFLWQEHLRFDGAEGAPATLGVATTAPPPTITLPANPASPTPPPPTLPAPPVPASEVRATPSTERPEGGVTGELERMRSEVARLATAQQELTQRLARGGQSSAPPSPIGSDGSAGAAALFFGAGAVVGWLTGRFGPGRRDRRSRLRL